MHTKIYGAAPLIGTACPSGYSPARMLMSTLIVVYLASLSGLSVKGTYSLDDYYDFTRF
ncbi:hypothetical protein [Paenibacillus larvae]|uniref:hypothetical protein n=1 Tax=Paenibacillus larvae TaxID=1464 RepID=UPI00289E8A83|nr:hypothetical protein [Paenibacillus larvae]